MFLPSDLTSSEEDLAATVTRQLLAHRQPGSPEEEAAVRQEAAEVAAEMILAGRGETTSTPEDEGTPETAYHSWLRNLVERQRQLQAEEAAEADLLR